MKRSGLKAFIQVFICICSVFPGCLHGGFIAIGPAIADKSSGGFSSFSRFSGRFPDFSGSVKAQAGPGTHFHAQKSIFHHKIKF